ncbi:HMG-box [Neoconidiobolus thromboides FSU 785]|nr:HMG-box [Neoconidiobolus thromboides FSU 785]
MLNLITKFNFNSIKTYTNRALFHTTNLALKNKDYPARPKRPGNAYTIFVRENFPKTGRDSGMSTTQVISNLSEEWKSLDSGKKVQYEEKYQMEAKEYEKRLEDWEKQLTNEEREAYNQDITKKGLKGGRKMKKVIDHNKPKKPVNAYLLFCKDKRNETNYEFGHLSIGEQGTQLGNLWKTIDSETKQKYVSQYNKESQQYKEALAKYHEEN